MSGLHGSTQAPQRNAGTFGTTKTVVKFQVLVRCRAPRLGGCRYGGLEQSPSTNWTSTTSSWGQQGQILGALMPCDQRRGQYRSAQLSPKSTRRSGWTHFTWPGWWDIWWSDGNFTKFHLPEEHGLKRVELVKFFSSWKVSLTLLGQHKNIQLGTFLPLFFSLQFDANWLQDCRDPSMPQWKIHGPLSF